MERKTLTTTERTDFRKGVNRRLRKDGKIPAIIYGHTEPRAIALDELEFNRKFHYMSENMIITLKTEDRDYDVLIKDYQEDVLTERILHIDFFAIDEKSELSARVPIHIEGTAAGVREGGILETYLYELDIQCLPKDLPDNISVDITPLEIGDSIHVSDLEVPEGVKLLHEDEQVLIHISHQRIEEEEVEEEELEEGLEGEEVEGEEVEGEEEEEEA